MPELSIDDLDNQTSEMLPEREALSVPLIIGSFDNHVIAINNAEAIQALTIASSNHAAAIQNVIVD
jgi:hypothetical protein